MVDPPFSLSQARCERSFNFSCADVVLAELWCSCSLCVLVLNWKQLQNRGGGGEELWWRRVWSLHNGGLPVMRFTAFCGASFQRFVSFWSCNNLCLIRSQWAKSTNLTSMTHPHWQVRVGTRDLTGLVEEAKRSELSIWFDPESWGTLELISQQFIDNCLENRFLTEINISIYL